MQLLWVDDHAPADDPLERAMRDAVAGVPWQRAGSLDAARSLLEREPGVHLAFVDLGLADGAGAIQFLREAAPLVTLIALSADERRGTVMGAISAGAAGFIVKTASPATVLAALRLVLDGGIPLPVSILERRTPDRPGYGTWVPTPRSPEALGYPPDEAVVLQQMVRGRPEALIARTTGMADPLVKAHLATVFRRLGASSRSQAVLEAARLGLRFGPLQETDGSRASSIASP